MKSPRDLADRMRRKRDDGFLRETFTLSRVDARATAKEWLSKYPKPAYMSEVESWSELPGDQIKFTMKRLPTAD